MSQAALDLGDMDLQKLAENGTYYAMKRQAVLNAMIDELKWAFFRPSPKTGLPELLKSSSEN